MASSGAGEPPCGVPSCRSITTPCASTTVDASTRKRGPSGFTAPAVCALGLGSDLCGMASSRCVGVSPSPSFDTSPPSRLICPLLTSRSGGLLGHRHPLRRKARPPRSFAARPPDLRRLALVTRASWSLARSLSKAPPLIRFLFVGPQLHSPRPSRRSDALRFDSLAVTNLREDFPPPSRCPCRAHQENGGAPMLRRRRAVTADYFIGHLSWKLSWLSSTMVATVLSKKSPLASFTTSCR